MREEFLAARDFLADSSDTIREPQPRYNSGENINDWLDQFVSKGRALEANQQQTVVGSIHSIKRQQHKGIQQFQM